MSKLPENLSNNDHVIHCCTFQASRKYDIIMWNRDKFKIPHFHVVDNATGGNNFHVRVLIEKPSYYKGETAYIPWRDITTMCAMLDYKGCKSDPLCPNESVWDQMIKSWNLSNHRKIKITERPWYEEMLNK